MDIYKYWILNSTNHEEAKSRYTVNKNIIIKRWLNSHSLQDTQCREIYTTFAIDQLLCNLLVLW